LPPVPIGDRQKVDFNRKKQSYEIELSWYKSLHMIKQVRLPALIDSHANGLIYAIEDLSQDSFTPVKQISLELLKSILKALASFHATFLDIENPFWKVGGYWSLDKRLFEWQSMPNQNLKNQAQSIDHQLNTAKYQTIIHGDFKLANILHDDKHNIAFVDFQYPGAGVGVKDLVTLFASIPDENYILHQEELIDYYFNELRKHPKCSEELEQEWRSLYPVAWADYLRFLDGWI